MKFSQACAISFFLAICSSGASVADTCTDGLLPQQQETLLLQHQVSVESDQDTGGFLDSALAFIFGDAKDPKNDSAGLENESSLQNKSDAGSSADNGGVVSEETDASSNSTNGNLSTKGSAAGNESDETSNGSNGSSSENATGADGNASENGSAAGNTSDVISNDSNGPSSDNATDGNVSKNGSDAGKHNVSAANVPLPLKEQLMFDALAANLNNSRQALASADKLISDFKKQTALEIQWGETAALAEATKLDALHEMNRRLNESMSLERDVVSNIPNHAKGHAFPHTTSGAADKSFEASDAAAQAAKLAQVVHVAESNYSAAIAQAYDARRKRDVLSSTLLKLLNSSITDDRNLTGLVDAIHSTYYLNLSGDTEIKAKGNTSQGNLTEIVKADIERFSPPSSTTTTTSNSTSTNTTGEPDEVPDPAVPSITVTIVNEGDDGSDAKQIDHHKEEARTHHTNKDHTK